MNRYSEHQLLAACPAAASRRQFDIPRMKSMGKSTSLSLGFTPSAMYPVHAFAAQMMIKLGAVHKGVPEVSLSSTLMVWFLAL
jgi:hypothetical protein